MPERICVIDICESPSGLRMLEFNPFSGADLYSCSPRAIVDAVQDILCSQE
jgi:hypothetical protein